MNAETPDASATIFTSANDTLAAVFASPNSGKTLATQPRTPSPRKRGYRESDSDADAEEIQRMPAFSENEDTAMETEDEDVAIIASPSPSPTRPLRPLKKSARAYTPVDPLVWPNGSITSSDMDTNVPGSCIPSGASKDWKDMFNQEF